MAALVNNAKPYVSVPRIDWTNPLTNGLIGCYLPGTFQGTPIGVGPLLARGDGGVGSRVNTKEGYAYSSTTAGANKGLIANAPAAFTGSAFSCYWRGVLVGNCDSFGSLIGVTYTNSDTAPFYVYLLSCDSGGYTNLWTSFNSGGTQSNGTSFNVTGTFGSMQSFCGTFLVGGNASLYQNGVQLSVNTLGVSLPITSNPQLIINQYVPGTPRTSNSRCTLAFFWNRELSASEVLRLDKNPYGFLIYPEEDLALVGAVVAAPSPVATKTAANIFRPGAGPSRGLFTAYSTFIPAQVVTASLSALGSAQAKGSSSSRGSVPILVIGQATAKGSPAIRGLTALATTGTSMAEGRAIAGAAAALAAKGAAQAKAGATPTGAASIAARGAAQAKAAAATAGVVGLAAVAKAMAQARSAPSVVANLVALAGAIKGMAAGRAVVSAAAALQALVGQGTGQAKGAATIAGRVQLAVTAKSQAQATGAAGLFAMLVAAGRAQAQGRAAARLLAMLSGTGAAQSGGRSAAAGAARLVSRGTAQATASAPVGAIAALTALVTQSGAMATARSVLAGITVIVPQPGGGVGYAGIRSFTRKRWKELQDLIAAEQALARKPKAGAITATEGARDALEALEEFAPVEARAQFERDMRRLTGMVKGAANAKKVSASAAKARVAATLATELRARVEAYLEQEEEEIRLLLE